LDENGINRNRAIQDILVRLVGIRALRSRSQEVLLASIRVHQGAELIGERCHMQDSGLKVKVKAIQTDVSKGSKSF
jgi:hypothetical protein